MQQIINKTAKGKAAAYHGAVVKATLPVKRFANGLSDKTGSAVNAVVAFFKEEDADPHACIDGCNGCDTHSCQLTLEHPVKELMGPKSGVHHMVRLWISGDYCAVQSQGRTMHADYSAACNRMSLAGASATFREAPLCDHCTSNFVRANVQQQGASVVRIARPVPTMVHDTALSHQQVGKNAANQQVTRMHGCRT